MPAVHHHKGREGTWPPLVTTLRYQRALTEKRPSVCPSAGTSSAGRAGPREREQAVLEKKKGRPSVCPSARTSSAEARSAGPGIVAADGQKQ